MDKNTLVGFALIGAVVIGFSIYNRPSQEEMARAKHYQDSIQAIAQKEAERLAQAATAQSQNATLHLGLPASSATFQRGCFPANAAPSAASCPLPS